MRTMLAPLALLAVIGTAGLASAAPAGVYAPSTSIKLGGAGGWDYATLNASGTLLYLPRSTHTQVVSTASGKVVGDIPGNQGSHGVALVTELNRGFITNGKDGTVQVFDLRSNVSLGRIKAEDDADGVIYDKASKRVLAMCGDAGRLVVIDPGVSARFGQAEASIDLGGKPEFAAVDGTGEAFVNLVDKNQVAVVDTTAMKVVAHWPTGTGTGPTGIAIDPVARLLFVGCGNQKLIVMKADGGQVVAELPIGKGVDAVAFDGKAALASCGDGTLSVVGKNAAGKFEVLQTVKTAPRARTMALDAARGLVYLPTADMAAAGGARPKPVPGTFRVLVVKKGKV